MALVKCKECSTEISTSAKACPKCGAKPPQKTSVVTWLVLAVIAVVVFNSFSSDPGSTTSTASTSSASSGTSTGTETKKKEVVERKAPSWSTFDSSDEMSGEKSSFAVSPKTAPTRRMDFPYAGVEAQLAIGCDSSSEWVYVSFTTAPNLSNSETKDGYSLVNTRVRWDDAVVREQMTQKWGAEFMHFRDKSAVIQKVAGASSVMIELDWHGQGAVRFPFTLNGSSAAVQEIRGKCAQY